MSKVFEIEEVAFVGRLARFIQDEAPSWGGSRLEVEARLLFEDEPTGLAIGLDGAGENYVVKVTG